MAGIGIAVPLAGSSSTFGRVAGLLLVLCRFVMFGCCREGKCVRRRTFRLTAFIIKTAMVVDVIGTWFCVVVENLWGICDS